MENIQLAQVYHKSFGSIVFDFAQENIIYNRMQDVARLPGYDYNEKTKKLEGRGYVAEDVGESGLEFSYKLTLAGKYKTRAEIFLKILQSKEPFFFKPNLSNFTPMRLSKVNPTLLTTKGFYVTQRDSITFRRDDTNLAIIEIDVNFVEVKYIKPANLNILDSIDSALAKLSDILADISLYITYATNYIQATSAFLNNMMAEIKSIGEDISNLTATVNNLANTIDNLIAFPETIATQYQNIAGEFSTTFDRLSNVGNNRNENKYAQNRLVNTATNLATYNQNPTLNTQINNRYGFVNIDGVKDNITQGKFTTFIRNLGFTLLLSLADKLNFNSKEEIDLYITKLTQIKDAIFNDTSFDGISNSNQSLDLSLTNLAYDIELLDILNNIYYQVINDLKDQKVILGNEANITLLQDTSIHALIYRYYYQTLLNGTDLELIYLTFLNANNLYDANAILPKGYIISLPIL